MVTKNVLKPIQEKNDVYVLSEVEIVSAVKEKKITYVQVNVTYCLLYTSDAADEL